MKRAFSLFLAIAMVVGLLAGCNSPTDPSGEQTQNGGNEPAGDSLKIAVIAAVTGTSASDGASMANAIQMAADEINAAGGVLGKNIEVEIIDGGSTADSALNVAQRIASSDEYVSIFGPHFSSQILAIGDTLAEAQVPVITGGTVKTVLETVTSEWVIRNRCPDTVVADAAAKFMDESMGVKKVGFICANDDFGTGARLVAQEYFDSVGIEYVSESFNVDDNDVTSQLLKLRDEGVDSLFVWSLGSVFATVVRQIAELGMNDLPVMASSALTFPDIQALLEPEYTENWYVNTQWSPTLTDEASVAFTEGYEALYDIEPNMLAAAWYSTTYWLADCLERAESADPNELLAAMQATEGYQTLSGTFTYEDREEIIDVYAGDVIQEYYAAVPAAQQLYKTQRAVGKQLIICNANARSNEATIAYQLATLACGNDGAEIVMIDHSARGQVTHYLLGTFGDNAPGRLFRSEPSRERLVRRIICYMPYYVSTDSYFFGEREKQVVARTWEEVMGLLKGYGAGTKCSVLVDGTMEYFELEKELD